MSQYASLKAVKKTLENRSGYEISKLTGVTEAGVAKWRKGGDEQLLKMSFKNAIKMTELYSEQSIKHFEEIKEMVYQSIPELIKKEPEIAAEIIVSQVDMLIEACEAKKLM